MPHSNLATALLATTLVTCLAAPTGAQELTSLPRDLFAAAARLPVQPSVEDGTTHRFLDAKGRPLANLVVLHSGSGRRFMMGRNKVFQLSLAAGLDDVGKTIAPFVMLGERYRTDKKGTVQLPPGLHGNGEFVVFRGRQVLHVRQRMRQAEFRFPPSTPVYVAVVDVEGRPVKGIPVRFGYETDPVPTNRKGIAKLIRNMEMPQLIAQPPFVLVDVLAKERLMRQLPSVDIANSPDAPISFTVPEFARVEVEVRTPEGKLLPKTFNVTLATPDRKSSQLKDAVGGRAVFPRVEVGLEVKAIANLGNRALRESKVVKVPGAGKTEQVPVIVEKIPQMIDVRLIGVDGKPVANEVVGMVLLGQRASRNALLRTGADGRVRYTVTERLFDADEKVEVRLQRVRHSDSGTIFDKQPARAYLGAFRGSLWDVCKPLDTQPLQLQKPHVYLSGRVVDEFGEPVAGVPLSGYPAEHDGKRIRGPKPYFQPWVLTDAEGRFAFAELGAKRDRVFFRVRSMHPVLKQPKLPLADPTTDIEIQVAHTQPIRGKLAGFGPNEFPRVSVTTEWTGPDGKVHRRLDGVKHGGGFEIGFCRVGTHRVLFGVGPRRETFHTIENVKVERGKPCVDPRLQKLDIRAKVPRR